MPSSERYDIVIIGTGAGGGTLAYHLANAGKRVLILERGPFLPQEKLHLHCYVKQRILLEGVGRQNGTCRFGTDPKQSVLDINCRTHDLDNLYIVDGSFFAFSGAVNPSLTIIANALRVPDHLLERLH